MVTQRVLQLDANFDNDLQRIAVAVNSAKNVVVIIGAGVSTAANIPDFRSKTGLYMKENIFSNAALGDSEKRADLLSVALELRQRATKAEPTDTHRFIRTLRERGQLLRCYSQNIDMIEGKADLITDIDSNADCIPLHGSLCHLRCQLCRSLFDWNGFEASIGARNDLPCPKCRLSRQERIIKGLRPISVGNLLPDIELLGAEHVNGEAIAEIINSDLAAGPDLLLVLGTSLRVFGPNKLVSMFARVVNKRGGTVVYTNLSTPPRHPWSSLVDYVVQGDCDSWVADLRRRLLPELSEIRSLIEEACEQRGRRKTRRRRGLKEKLQKERAEKEKKQDGSAEHPFVIN